MISDPDLARALLCLVTCIIGWGLVWHMRKSAGL